MFKSVISKVFKYLLAFRTGYKLGIVFVIVSLLSTIVLAQVETSQTNPRLWNLSNVDIQTVIEEISKETNKNFLIDPRVSGKVNIISNHPMDSDEIYQVFLSILEVLGYSAIDSGEVIKIVPASSARHMNTPVTSPRHPGRGDEVIVQVLPVKNISAAKMVPILRPLLPETGNISAYAPGNALVISGTADNVSRIRKIVSQVDQADTSDVEIIPLQQATAAKVVSVIRNLQGTDKGPSAQVNLAADDHTNSVLLRGDLQSRLKIRVLIAQLDAPSPAGSTGNTQVINLHYLKAKDLAPILTKIATGESEDAEGKNPSPEQHVSIQAEPTTNTIIITAPPTMMTNLKAVINDLDDRPAQVLVEAAIVEVRDSALKDLGILWGELINEGTKVRVTDNTRTGNGLPSGFSPGIGIIKNGDLREVIHFISSDSSADLLSTPSVMVLDNQQAKIEVGKTISIETGSYASTDGTTSSVNPFKTFTRDNIGLHLYVTPQINRGDAVQLEIDQGNETLENPVDVTTTPVTNSTVLQTTVLVKSKDILVLGGLISNVLADVDSKIPFAGDIPVIGRFFQYKTRRFEKRNLMIFLKPTIVRKPGVGSQVTEAKYNFVRNDQILWESRKSHLFPEDTGRVLPPWDSNTIQLPVPFSNA